MTISNNSRARIKAIFEPIALGMGRLGLTPDGLTLIGFGITVVGAILVGLPALDRRRSRRLHRRRLRHVRWHPRPGDRQGQQARRVHGLHVRQAGARSSSSSASSPGARSPGDAESPLLVAAAAMGAAFMVSYARAKSEGLGFTSGIGHGGGRGHAPRDPPRDHVARARPDRDAHRHHGHRVRPRRHPVGATITVIQRILHVRSQARVSPPQTPRPRRKGATENSSEQERQRQRQERRTPANTWAGSGRRGDGKIRVAIVGVGNCASSLVQGRYYYENAKDDDFVPGLMHVNLGGYHVRDIDFVAAFDIDKNKVGKDLSEAIYTKPNNTYVFQKVEKTGVTVERGMVHDGLGKYL